MREIDPTVTLPYWQFPESFAAPEKDIIFEWFAHAGSQYKFLIIVLQIKLFC